MRTNPVRIHIVGAFIVIITIAQMLIEIASAPAAAVGITAALIARPITKRRRVSAANTSAGHIANLTARATLAIDLVLTGILGAVTVIGRASNAFIRTGGICRRHRMRTNSIAIADITRTFQPVIRTWIRGVRRRVAPVCSGITGVRRTFVIHRCFLAVVVNTAIRIRDTTSPANALACRTRHADTVYAYCACGTCRKTWFAAILT